MMEREDERRQTALTHSVFGNVQVLRGTAGGLAWWEQRMQRSSVLQLTACLLARSVSGKRRTRIA